jgi:magnesium transporter
MRKNYSIADHKLVETQDAGCQVAVFINPDEGERKYLIEQLKLDEHTLLSALDPDELSRVEFEPEHAAIIFKSPKNYSAAEQFLFKVSSVGAFLFKDSLIIVVAEDVPLFDRAAFTRVYSPAGLLLRLISRSIIHFREHLKVINMISDELQSEINRAMENKHLLNLFTLQKSLVYYVNAINSNGALIEKLKNTAARIGFAGDEQEFLDDILIENGQCFKQADMYSNILASLMDARASIVSNNLNVLMKTLNIIMICLMLPTLVVSIFSMNVTLPMTRNEASLSHPVWFWGIVGVASLSVLIVLLFWRYRKW